MKTYGKNKLTVDQMHSNPSDAKAAKHIHYFTGKPCKHGHIAPRYVKRYSCTECNRIEKERRYIPHPRKLLTPEERAKRKKAYYLKHQEQIKAFKQQYWIENKEKLSLQNAEWKKNNPENERIRSQKRYEADPEKFIKKSKSYYQKNKEVILEKKRQYRAANKEIIREQSRAYYLKKKKEKEESE